MDFTWDSGAWDPTISWKANPKNRWEPPSNTELPNLIADLAAKSRLVLDLPYNAMAWYTRSTVLLKLGYPELAAGDAYKGLLLVFVVCREMARDSQVVIPQDGAELFLTMEAICSEQCNNPDLHAEMQRHLSAPDHAALAMLDQALLRGLIDALMAGNAMFDALRMCVLAAVRYPGDTYFRSGRTALQNLSNAKREQIVRLKCLVSGEDEVEFQMRSGSTFRRVYPWMTQTQYQRAPEVLGIVRAEFEQASGSCNVAASPARDSITAVLRVSKLNKVDVVGVFATKDIKKGETVLVDTLGLSATNVAGLCNNCCSPLKANETAKLTCCAVEFCSAQCAEDAKSRYHPRLCGKDFSSIQADAAKTDFNVIATETLLFIRMLAAIRQQNKANPLEANVIARMTMLSEGWEPTPFDLPNCIIGPMKVAQTFGADVFKERNYDTWALLTILYRIRSNRFSQPVEGGWVSSLNLLHCFFNHHCRPNVQYGHDAMGLFDAPSWCTHKTMVAVRDVKKGEELFISYIPEDVRTRAERRRLLKPWIGTDCLCSSCVDDGDGAGRVHPPAEYAELSGMGQPPAEIVALAEKLGINIRFISV